MKRGVLYSTPATLAIGATTHHCNHSEGRILTAGHYSHRLYTTRLYRLSVEFIFTAVATRYSRYHAQCCVTLKHECQVNSGLQKLFVTLILTVSLTGRKHKNNRTFKRHFRPISNATVDERAQCEHNEQMRLHTLYTFDYIAHSTHRV